MEQPQKISEFRAAAEAALRQLYDAREAQAIVKRWLSERLSLAAHELNLQSGELIPQYILTLLKQDFDKLLQCTPLQYMLGFTDFYGLRLKVKEGVLIPRPETEELVDWALKSGDLPTKATILDVGTGSGAIALAMKAHLPLSRVDALDVSPKALEVASGNARTLGLAVTFIQGDILSLSPTHLPACTLLISNPPYVPASDAETLASNVRDYEPSLALFAPSENPLLFYQRIVTIAQSVLEAGGWLYLECHDPTAEAVVTLCEEARFGEIALKRDLNDKRRMLRARRI